MDKLKMQTPDMMQRNIERIAELFPNVVTEKKDENGVLRKAINFEKLKQELADEVTDGEECYDFTWVGKKASIIEANTPIRKTLRPCIEESKNWETTGNIYIEGDNLEALKLLQESYLNSIKMIYIDPPYNTGNDYIYKDKFNQSKDEYEEESGAFDEEGNRLFLNSENNGRFHSDWCSMIFPRLKLAHNLLRDDGLIFISIDDNEINNLKKICDEIFGEDNLINVLIWKKRYNAAKEKHLAVIHEYVLIYSKNRKIDDFDVPGTKEYFDKYFTEKDENYPIRGCFMTQPLEAGNSMDDRDNLRFPIKSPEGDEIWPRRQWVWGKDRVDSATKNGMLKFNKDKQGNWTVRHKHYMKDENGNFRRVKPFSIFEGSYTQEGGKEIENIFGNSSIFAFPKTVSLIKHLLELVNEPDAYYLDFFSGSATTADAIMQLNSEDGGNRKFILVQLPEILDPNKSNQKAGYDFCRQHKLVPNIASIGKERIRRAGEKIKSEIAAKSDVQLDFNGGNAVDPESLDIGFRVLKVDSTNMKDVYYSAGEYNQDQLDMFETNVKDDRTPLDLLYQCLLDWGLPLSLPHTIEKIGKVTVHTVDNGSLIVCFDNNVPESVVREIASRKPLRVVFRDSSFTSSPEKINVTEIFKTLAPGTTVKVI